MRDRILVHVAGALVALTALNACAGARSWFSPASQAPVTYIEATPIAGPPPAPPPVVEVATPLPLPGQLRKLPDPQEEALGAEDDERRNPWEVIETANLAATQAPSEFGYFNAIMRYDYVPGALYQVYTAPLRLTDIELQPGETLLGKPAGGDTVRWIVGVGASKVDGQPREHVYVKPTRPGLHTTLAINTDRRTYHIELHSYKETYMAAVSWRYPADEIAELEARAAAREAGEAGVTATHVNLEALNFDYDIEVARGRPPWTPVQVFDDGRKTFIRFPKEMLVREAPALFVLSEGDETQLVNYRVKNDVYIVDRLFRRAELRLGQKRPSVVRLVNRAEPAEERRHADEEALHAGG